MLGGILMCERNTDSVYHALSVTSMKVVKHSAVGVGRFCELGKPLNSVTKAKF